MSVPADREDRLAGRNGDGPVQHVAGPLIDGVQRCSRCHGVIVDYRDTMTNSPEPLRGFAEGPIVADGNCTVAGFDPAVISCDSLAVVS